MAAKTPDVGQGATIAFSTSFFATATNFEWSGISRGAKETTTLATTTAKTFMPEDLYDPGELSVDMQFDTDSAWTTALAGAAETVTITWPDSETAACSGFMTGFRITASGPEVMSATGTLKFSGPITA